MKEFMFRKTPFYLYLTLSISLCACQTKVYHLSDYGVHPGKKKEQTEAITEAIQEILQQRKSESEKVILQLEKGEYHFYASHAAKRQYYISNHDPLNQRKVGIVIESCKNIIFDGNGSKFVYHGRMLPLAITYTENVQLKNFSIDFTDPQIAQFSILKNDTSQHCLTLAAAPWVKASVKDSTLIVSGYQWESTPNVAMAFEAKTKHVAYNTSDIPVYANRVEQISDHHFKAWGWKDARLKKDMVLTLRTFYRPNPGIFIERSNQVDLASVKVHYAEGMGLVAQTSQDISLDHFSVCLKGDSDPRYFTTQADATHFSGCKGKIISINGTYENMMDDAINVHGTYLKIIKQENPTALVVKYMHPQSKGFFWGEKGDEIQIVSSKTMETLGERNKILSISPIDAKERVLPGNRGASGFIIILSNPVHLKLSKGENYGIENLTWTPSVHFVDNYIANNRARGALFSTPKKVVVQHNTFYHTSGSAILLSGDCNGWYETGACRDVLIKQNTFKNSLTSLFQFTNAVISINPEIPSLSKQKKYFHHNIRIEENKFEVFDAPLVYAKSVNGLTFVRNTIKTNNAYKPYHWNTYNVYFERVKYFKVRNNYPEELSMKRTHEF